MIFYRTQSGAAERSVAFVRSVSSASLIAYPAGAVTLALGPDILLTTIIGYGLVFIALVGAAALAGTSTQRIVAEEVAQLDEDELQLRHRAMATAYSIFTGLMLMVVIYAALAADFGGWVPTTYEEYNGLFWGVFIYASMLPTACLAWRLDPVADQIP